MLLLLSARMTQLLGRFCDMTVVQESSSEWSSASISTASDGQSFERRHSTQSSTLYGPSSAASSPYVRNALTEPYPPNVYRTSLDEGDVVASGDRRESVVDSIGKSRKYKNPWGQVNILSLGISNREKTSYQPN